MTTNPGSRYTYESHSPSRCSRCGVATTSGTCDSCRRILVRGRKTWERHGTATPPIHLTPPEAKTLTNAYADLEMLREALARRTANEQPVALTTGEMDILLEALDMCHDVLHPHAERVRLAWRINDRHE